MPVSSRSVSLNSSATPQLRYRASHLRTDPANARSREEREKKMEVQDGGLQEGERAGTGGGGGGGGGESHALLSGSGDRRASRVGKGNSIDTGRCGTLYKTGAGALGRRWRRRAFRLVVESSSLKPTLLYYEEGGGTRGGSAARASGRVRGAISLCKVKPGAVTVSERNDGFFKVRGSEFNISVEGRVYRLCSETAEDAKSWVDHLNTVVQAYHDCAPASSSEERATSEVGITSAGGDDSTTGPDDGGGGTSGDDDRKEEKEPHTMEERLKNLEDELTDMVLEKQQEDGQLQDESEDAWQQSSAASTEGDTIAPLSASPAAAAAHEEEQHSETADAGEVSAKPPPMPHLRSISFDDRSQAALIVLLKERDDARAQVSQLQRENRNLSTRCDLLKTSLLDRESALDDLREYCNTLESML